MRWLIIQSAGEHDGIRDNWTPNYYLRECLSLQFALERAGQQCDIWGKHHSNFDKVPPLDQYDVIFLVENSDLSWVPDFSSCKALKIQWIIDLHCNRNTYLKWSPMCDVVLHSTKSLMNNYQSFPNQKHIWFPNSFDERYFVDKKLERPIDVAFIGSIEGDRREWLRLLNVEHLFLTGIDMINKISSIKIHFNKTLSTDVNYRCFETIGLGTCLLTNYLSEMEELGFKDKENCLFYRNIEECKEKISFALNNEEWKRIGLNAHEFAKSQTYSKRIEALLKEL